MSFRKNDFDKAEQTDFYHRRTQTAKFGTQLFNQSRFECDSLSNSLSCALIGINIDSEIVGVIYRH